MIKHRFNIPRARIELTRREANSARFRESLKLRETVGYLQNDRHALTEGVPALLLTSFEIKNNDSALVALETLSTMEGKIVRDLASYLDFDKYRFVLSLSKRGAIQGVDFELTPLATRSIVRRALTLNFDDAADIAKVMVDYPR